MEQEYVEGTMAHWLVFYRMKCGKLYNITVDATSRTEALQICKAKCRGFKDYERMADGRPIIKRKIYLNEMRSAV